MRYFSLFEGLPFNPGAIVSTAFRIQDLVILLIDTLELEKHQFYADLHLPTTTP
jgi:hypothetical protein